MRIDWSKVPRGTPVKEMGGDEPYLFLRYEDDGVVVQDISGRAFVFAPEEVILYSVADIKKYAVPDIKETARRIVDRAADSLDEDEAGERLIDEMVGALLSVEDVARAYLDGKTVLYRPVGSGVGGWIVARGTHNIDFDKYEYRVVAKQPSGSMQYNGSSETLQSIIEIARAFMEGKTILYRSHFDMGEWTELEEGHVPDMEAYAYKVQKKTRGGTKMNVVSMNDEEKAIIADTHRGFYRKYHITKADGSPTDPKADYFVLRLDEDNPWGHACREAVLGLARNLRNEFPQLTSDLLTRYGKKSADAMVIKGPVRDAHFDGLEVSIARERIKAGECDKEVLERYEKIWMGDNKVTPLNLCIAEQVVQEGFCDKAVISRYDRLRREGLIRSYAEFSDKTAPEFRKEPVDEKPVLKIREPLTNTDVDRATVERFNELSKAARLERLSSDGWVPTIYDSYRLRPTPRYRPYDPAKDSICLPKFCEAQIHTESDGELAVIEAVNTHGVVARFYDGDGNHRTTAHITWEALAQWWRGEDNEPFGVKL